MHLIITGVGVLLAGCAEPDKRGVADASRATDFADSQSPPPVQTKLPVRRGQGVPYWKVRQAREPRLHLSALSAGCNEGHRRERANALGVLAAARGLASSRPIASNISSLGRGSRPEQRAIPINGTL